ncbi:MAG: multiheme c-type cytochrome [Myxococcota bacterium]
MRTLSLAATAAAIAAGIAAGGEPDLPWFEGGRGPLFVGPAPEASDCAPCHAAIVAEWQGSLHAGAWTDPIFQAAFARQPLPFCRHCHAPLDGASEASLVAQRDGISCAVCHVRDGDILGRGAGLPAPHGVRATPELGRSDYCAPCHEFGFLGRGVAGGPRREGRDLQQATFSEWQASGAAVGCRECHMPLVDGHRSHRFAATRDPAALARAVRVEVGAERGADAVAVVARLTLGDVGHAFPSGDLNRRLELRAWTTGEAPLRPSLVFARSYGERAEPGVGAVMFVTGDARVGVGDEVRQVALRAAPGATIRWRLDYLLMPDAVAGELGVARALNVTTIASGEVTAPR